jgi:8-oxo-dGTP diphosphatase
VSIDVVAAIIFYNNKILAAQRPFSLDKDISLKYEFPGGKVNKNETNINALKRELQEELNMEVEKLSYYFSSGYDYKKKKVKLYFYKCVIFQLPTELRAHKAFKLLSLKHLRTVDWLAGDYAVIDKLEADL